MSNRTLLAAWEAFENSCPNNLSLIQSALLRFTVPGLGGKKPSGARLTSKETVAALKILDSIPILEDIAETLKKAQEQSFILLNTPKKSHRKLKFYLNKFIDWAINNGFFVSTNTPKKKQRSIVSSNSINKSKKTNRQRSEKFIISFKADNYNNKESLDPEQIQYHLQRIDAEIKEFKNYEISVLGKRSVSVEIHEKRLGLLLGWLYRKKGTALNQLSLKNLVPFIKVNLDVNDFASEEGKDQYLSYITHKAIALDNLKKKADYLVNLLIEFFCWLENPPSYNAKRHYVEALIAYSKYVYRNETDQTMALNFEDIPLVNRLKVFAKEIRKNGKSSRSISSNHYLHWDDIQDVLEYLRIEANLEISQTQNYRNKRSLSARAKSLQNFILLGLFTLIPPSRQRVIRELELGRTFKYGILEKGRFIPFSKMLNPREAKYYIYLQPEDYKTGDIYGEWVAPFPNVVFSDGSKFYDYLNRWLFQGYQDQNGEWHGMRELIASPEAKTVFVGGQKGNSHDTSSMSIKIRNIFLRWTGIPLKPHDLRHIYRSFIEDPATGATAEEKKSAAFWMRHSNQMAAKVYAHLNCEQNLCLGMDLNTRINGRLART